MSEMRPESLVAIKEKIRVFLSNLDWTKDHVTHNFMGNISKIEHLKKKIRRLEERIDLIGDEDLIDSILESYQIMINKLQDF